ncbi:hypothetical protein PXJ20_28015 [Paraburkholderia sp. A1RI_3L]|uniref:hypothetical protein n=2 Tax=Paraburkholderia TaxID=1822464 RepID=UPI000B161A45|nr:hypothetical protein [Paraburkholderia kururiensis]
MLNAIRGAPFDAQSTITSVNPPERKRMKWKEWVKEARKLREITENPRKTVRRIRSPSGGPSNLLTKTGKIRSQGNHASEPVS